MFGADRKQINPENEAVSFTDFYLTEIVQAF